ncbi:MAG: hypothetical protein ACOY9Y_10700 [Bacillota bacterium]
MSFDIDMNAIFYGFFFTMKLIWPFVAVVVLAGILMIAIKNKT